MALNTGGIPGGAAAGTVISIGPCGAGLPLPPGLFATGCTQYVSPVFANLGLILGATCNGSLTLTIPPNPSLDGVQFCLQSGALGTGGVETSNALDCVIGGI